jgi:adenylate cyclase
MSSTRLICFGILLFFFTASVLAIQNNLFGSKELGRSMSLDIYTQLEPFQGNTDQLENFLFIDIDETSLNDIGQWPWPRVLLAKAFKTILSAKPAVVGVDILLAESDRFNPKALADLAKDKENIVEQYFFNGDRILGEVISGQPVILATAFNRNSKNTIKNKSQLLIKQKARFDIPAISGIIFPINELNGAEGFGFVNVDLDNADNTVRYLPLLANLNGKIYPSFVLELIRVFEEDKMLNLDSSGNTFPLSVISTGFTRIPVTKETNFILHNGISERFSTLSMSKILDGSLDERDLKKLIFNKILILGSSASGLNDLHATNIEKAVPGPLIQLSAAHQILSERYLKFSIEADAISITLLLFALLTLFWISRKDKINIGLLVISSTGVIFLYTSFYLFSETGFIINLFLLFAFLISSLTMLLLQSTFIALNKRALQAAFGTYLAPEMVKEIESSGKQPELGGERKELSVVMTDMRNFTALGESYGQDVEGFTSTMNRYMTAIAQPVFDNKGTLLKFIGDASMHIHGAPINDDFHAFRSVETAIKMIKAVETFNVELVQERKPPVGIGIGINTGQILVGNIGAKTKFGYDVLGDPVSVAARLESQTKAYGVLLIVGSATFEMCKNDYDWWELDNIAVKGKEEPLRIYTIQKQTKEHEIFLKHYYEGNWDYILKQISSCKKAAPSMAAYYNIMFNRIKLGKPNKWDGIYRAKTK